MPCRRAANTRQGRFPTLCPAPRRRRRLPHLLPHDGAQPAVPLPRHDRTRLPRLRHHAPHALALRRRPRCRVPCERSHIHSRPASVHLSPARRSPLGSARRKKRSASSLRFLPPHRLRSFYDLAQFSAVKGSLSDYLCVATCRFLTFPSSICPNKLHRQRCVFFSSRLFLPRFRIRQPLDYRRGRIEGHPQCLCRLSYIGVYRRSDSPRYSERRARHFFALPNVSTKAAFFHATQSSDRSPQRHPPPTRPEPAGRSDPTAHVHMHKRHLCRYCAFLAAKLKYHVRLTANFDTI